MENLDNRFDGRILDSLYEGVYIIDLNKNISYWNKGAEQITGFTSSEVLGVHCREDILIYTKDGVMNLCKGQCPLSQSIDDGKVRETEVYFQHKDGHKVPVLLRAVPLRGTSGKVEGVIEIFSDNSSKMAYLERMEELQKVALLDPLTGLANRRYIESALTARLHEMQRYGWTFGVIFMDTDNFKSINDLYGHEIGDKALKMVAKTLVSSSRSFDMIGRWGGEEFVAIVVNVNENKLYAVANRFLALVEQSSFMVDSKMIRITLSVGATIARKDDTIDMLLARADKLMYHSKSAGGNRLTMKDE